MNKLFSGILILLFAAAAGYAQESKQPLQLTIKSDKQVYKVGEEIKSFQKVYSLPVQNCVLKK